MFCTRFSVLSIPCWNEPSISRMWSKFYQAPPTKRGQLQTDKLWPRERGYVATKGVSEICWSLRASLEKLKEVIRNPHPKIFRRKKMDIGTLIWIKALLDSWDSGFEIWALVDYIDVAIGQPRKHEPLNGQRDSFWVARWREVLNGEERSGFWDSHEMKWVTTMQN